MGRNIQTDIPMDALRRVVVHASGLGSHAPFGRARPGAGRALDHLGHVQIDTISVVARAHDHILASRVPGYRPEHLQQLMARREAFEYWAHAAAFLPMADYRQALPRMQRLAGGGRHWGRDNRQDQEMARVLDRIREEGPLRARDFEAPAGHQGGWWSWKPAKWALERLFQEGQLMVVGRIGFEKVFDLTERVLPAAVDTRTPTLDEHARWLVARARQSLGVFSARHVRYQRREEGLGRAVETAIADGLKGGKLLEVRHAQLPPGLRWYADRQALEQAGRRIGRGVRALSPFDPLVIHRDRLLALFGFDYQIECYLPEAKRRYGYFSLPLLSGTRFVGRADCKALRQDRQLICRHLALEPATVPADAEKLLEGFVALARMNDCDRIQVERVSGVSEREARRLARVLTQPVA
ncbi:MAG: YcaQ family DNA glycosylase [Gammaproteobacteria bacterium]|nr:YcaQ family DNA glycosylase [Gammaproteobacteria bacterium]